MKNKYKQFLFLFASALLIIASAPIFARFYEIFIGRQISGGFWGPTEPSYIEGFFASYLFYSAIIIYIFSYKNRWKYLFLSWLPVLGFGLLLGAWENFFINLFIAFLGAAVGAFVRFLFLKAQNNAKDNADKKD